MLKPVLCAAALAAVVAFPALAQQSPQSDTPSAGPAAPGPQSERDGRGGGWRGYPEGRYSDENGPGRRWRRGDEERRDGADGPRRWHERRFVELGDLQCDLERLRRLGGHGRMLRCPFEESIGQLTYSASRVGPKALAA